MPTRIRHCNKDILISSARVKITKNEIAAAFLLILFVGWIGGGYTWAGLGPNQSMAEKIFIIAIIYILGGIGIGLTLPCHWYVSVFNGWFPWLLLAFTYRETSLSGLGLAVAISLVALGGGYIGYRVRRMLARGGLK